MFLVDVRDAKARIMEVSMSRCLWADLGISLSPSEIEENRREMWKNFPSGI
jgi:hypothetical protein